MDLLDALRAFGRDAASFQAVEPDITVWHAPDGEGVVAYRDTGSAWVTVGAPLADASRVAEVARVFVDAARDADRRAVFFACDAVDALRGVGRALPIGEQPWWCASDWTRALETHRSLREQLRRARSKGVSVCEVSADALAAGTSLRGEVDALANAWLAGRPMQPMKFLLTLAMFEHAREHRYYAAKRDGALVAFASIVPIYAKNGWLIEDCVRDPRSPNGTTELLFDRVMCDAGEASPVTWGLAPLVNAPWPMRAIGALARGLYDFRGLRAFKARLHPRAWETVWMVSAGDRTHARSLLEVLRAFAGGSLVMFGARTLVRRPLVLAWVLTLLLVPWTAMLLVLLAFRDAAPLLGFPRAEIFAWAAFDAAFATALLRAFWRPRFGAYAFLGAAAAIDALVSMLHLAHAGLGASMLSGIARLASAVAPSLAAIGLFRCAAHTRATIVSK